MEEIGKLFNDLESKNNQEVKKRLTENFSLTKEPWLVQGMMDYFGQTKSVCIVDILVKIQPPHDRFLFDRLSEWIKGSHKLTALTMFGHIVRKHPTWLHKVSNHNFLRDLFKLLKTEKEIIPVISALLCIIFLLPIIPSPMAIHHLQDLFDVFSHLASWNCTNPTKLPDNYLVHLQVGLYTFFHRLYGMYPCHFIDFLRQEYTIKEKSLIFSHTIAPLLETIKMHPLLVMGNKDTEVNVEHWRKMEPHDVVVECARFTLDSFERTGESVGSIGGNTSLISTECTCGTNGTSHRPIETPILTSLRMTSSLAGPLSLVNNASRIIDASRFNTDNVWSPSATVLATPPPTGTIPHTPTPTLVAVPNYSAAMNSSQSSILVGACGASPPEAAVEATPETTPMKESGLASKNIRFSINSNAARSILGSSSASSSPIIAGHQPVSPMKKEPSPFRFPPDASSFTMISSESLATTTSQKLRRMLNDRSHSHMQLISSGNENSTVPNLDNLLRYDSPLTMESTQEDKEVHEITQTAKFDFDDDHNLLPMNAFSRKYYRLRTHLSDASESSSSPAIDENLNTHFRHIGAATNNSIHLMGGCAASRLVSTATQTLEQWPDEYEQFMADIYADEQRQRTRTKENNAAPITPAAILDRYIELAVTQKHAADARSWEQMFRDQIHLLSLQLQYERHRREVHAERNRRLLGKSRDTRSLKQHNETLRDQVQRLSNEIVQLNRQMIAKSRELNARETEWCAESNAWKQKHCTIFNENKELRRNVEMLESSLASEAVARKKFAADAEATSGELFDLRSDMQQALCQADLGKQYRDELTRMQSEMIMMGEIQIRCREKLAELPNLRAAETEIDGLHIAFNEEVQELKVSLENKNSQLETAKARLIELEALHARRETLFTDQKRLLKTVKEEYQEKFNALEQKYTTQKAIILRMEEHILELYKNQAAVNLTTLSPESDRTDMIGSLDHASPLSLSLASSDGLSASLSVNEIRNIQALVVQAPPATTTAELLMPKPTSSIAITGGSNNNIGAATAVATASSCGSEIQLNSSNGISNNSVGDMNVSAIASNALAKSSVNKLSNLPVVNHDLASSVLMESGKTTLESRIPYTFDEFNECHPSSSLG